MFVGREVELDAGRRLVTDVAAGRGRTSIVVGEGGIGKTHLIQRIRRLAKAAGVVWLEATADASERAAPLAVVRRALGSLGPVDGMSLAAALDAVEARAVAGPFVLCVEDLHHADDETLGFLRDAVQRFGAYAFGLITTTRPPQAQPAIAAFVDVAERHGAEIVELEPLSEVAVRELASEIVGATVGSTIIGQVERANGNPLFLTELLAAFVESGSVEIADGRAELGDVILPPSLTRTILRRIAVLPPDTVEVIRTAAVLGPMFSPADLAIVTGLGAIELAATLDPALASGFIHEEGQRLAFRHDLVHEALYTDVPEALRASIHLEIATKLRAAGRSAAGISHHVLAGATSDAPGAVDLVVSTEQELLIDVPSSVNVALLERVLEITEPWDERHIRCRVKRLAYLPGMSRYAELVEDARALLVAPLPEDLRPQVLERLANGLLGIGSLSEAEEVLARVIDDPLAQSQERFDAESLLAVIACHTGRFEECETRARDALQIDEPSPGDHARAWMVLCNSASIQGAAADAVTHGLRAVEAAERALAIGQGPASPGRSAAFALAATDRFDEALELLQRLRARYERIEGAPVASHLAGEADLLYRTGRWDEALVQAEAALAGGQPSAVPARIALHRGDMDGAAAWIDRTGEEPADRSIGWVSALVALHAGNVDDALAHLERGFRDPTVGFFFGTWRHSWTDLVKIARSASSGDLVREVVERASIARTRATEDDTIDAAVSRLEGLASDDGVALAAAADAIARTARIVEGAEAHEDAGDVLAGSGDGSAAGHLRQALNIWEGLEASADADRLRAKLRELGVRVGVKGRRARPSSGWAALTEMELRVAELVAEGLTNSAIGEQLYVSRHTVAAHLRSIFNKLGVSTRAEVAAQVVRSGS